MHIYELCLSQAYKSRWVHSQNLADLQSICRFHFLKRIWQLFYFSFWHLNYSLPTAWAITDVMSVETDEMPTNVTDSVEQIP